MVGSSIGPSKRSGTLSRNIYRLPEAQPIESQEYNTPSSMKKKVQILRDVEKRGEIRSRRPSCTRGTATRSMPGPRTKLLLSQAGGGPALAAGARHLLTPWIHYGSWV